MYYTNGSFENRSLNRKTMDIIKCPNGTCFLESNNFEEFCPSYEGDFCEFPCSLKNCSLEFIEMTVIHKIYKTMFVTNNLNFQICPKYLCQSEKVNQSPLMYIGLAAIFVIVLMILCVARKKIMKCKYFFQFYQHQAEQREVACMSMSMSDSHTQLLISTSSCATRGCVYVSLVVLV